MNINYHNLLGIIAGIVSIVAFIPYVVSIFQGNTKPERATWFIWSLVSVILLISYYSVGARSTIWIPLVYALAQIFVAILSIKKGVAGWNLIDKLSILGILLIAVIWFILKSVIVVLFAALLIDLLGLLPTVLKTYRNPRTENRIAWGISFFASLLNFIALDSFKPSFSAYPIYMLFNTGFIYIMTFKKND